MQLGLQNLNLVQLIDLQRHFQSAQIVTNLMEAGFIFLVSYLRDNYCSYLIRKFLQPQFKPFRVDSFWLQLDDFTYYSYGDFSCEDIEQ